MTKLLIIIFLLVQNLVFSQTDDLRKVDEYIRTLSFDKSISLDDLTEKITNPFDTDLKKVRAIYYWIADNIEYDYIGKDNGFWDNYSSTDLLIADTYRLRKGICSCYADLFKYMLDLCDIECEVINGYARCDLESIFVNESNHAWNSIKIDDRWSLFDVTWARDTTGNAHSIDNFWFQTNPDVFILTHFPENIFWTLIGTRYTLNDFKKFPIYTNLVHETHFLKELSKSGHFKAKDNSIKIRLKPTFKCTVLVKLYDIKSKEWFTPHIVDKVNEFGYFEVKLQYKGEFILKLGALKNDKFSFVEYKNLIYYTIENQ